ncbi:hypothetical protein [Aeromonas caviae]|nr:hypothetical protein [Aeromonas caviae]
MIYSLKRLQCSGKLYDKEKRPEAARTEVANENYDEKNEEGE